jgi:hypothetical protein
MEQAMRKSFMSTSRICRVLALALAAVPLVVSAQVYKWTDANGTVNYGNKPPPGARNVTQMNEDAGRVSTVPSISQEQIDAQRERAQQRQQQRDLESQRQYSGSGRAVTNDPNAYARWLEQCRAERRVDCDDPSRGAMNDSGGPVYYPGGGYPIVRPPRPQPPIGVAPQPPQAWPNNPNGAVVPSPPQPPGPRVAGRPPAATPEPR